MKINSDIRNMVVVIAIFIAGCGYITYDAFSEAHLKRCIERADEDERTIVACQDRGGKPVLKSFRCDDDVPRFYLIECRLHE